MYEISVTKTNLGNGLSLVNDNTGLHEQIIVPTEVIDSIAKITGDEEDAVKIYARFQNLMNSHNNTLDISEETHDGPNYYSLIIERVVSILYGCGISEEQIETVTSEMNEADIFGEIEGTEEMQISEYIDAYAMKIANIIKAQTGYTDDDNRRLTESFRGR